ncbi:hypothetical protein [Microbacterium maritypicum]|uniref:hypothetical protein n=1 Tax=Microbacterium maritypicum TaxID=33918 RepID=UPI001F370A2A|nr:hypothetical protein [Microbacterium liquefaciens]
MVAVLRRSGASPEQPAVVLTLLGGPPEPLRAFQGCVHAPLVARARSSTSDEDYDGQDRKSEEDYDGQDRKSDDGGEDPWVDRQHTVQPCEHLASDRDGFPADPRFLDAVIVDHGGSVLAVENAVLPPLLLAIDALVGWTVLTVLLPVVQVDASRRRVECDIEPALWVATLENGDAQGPAMHTLCGGP